MEKKRKIYFSSSMCSAYPQVCGTWAGSKMILQRASSASG